LKKLKNYRLEKIEKKNQTIKRRSKDIYGFIVIHKFSLYIVIIVIMLSIAIVAFSFDEIEISNELVQKSYFLIAIGIILQLIYKKLKK